VDDDTDPSATAGDRQITHVTDEAMQAALTTTRMYTIAILRQGPAYGDDGARAIVWEHGRRNFGLRADGLLNVVCPVMDDSDVCGVGIFDAPVDEVDAIMAGDPGVVAGVFVYDLHPCRGFPGDALAP
jgi:hypothetical protein